MNSSLRYLIMALAVLAVLQSNASASCIGPDQCYCGLGNVSLVVEGVAVSPGKVRVESVRVSDNSTAAGQVLPAGEGMLTDVGGAPIASGRWLVGHAAGVPAWFAFPIDDSGKVACAYARGGVTVEEVLSLMKDPNCPARSADLLQPKPCNDTSESTACSYVQRGSRRALITLVTVLALTLLAVRRVRSYRS